MRTENKNELIRFLEEMATNLEGQQGEKDLVESLRGWSAGLQDELKAEKALDFAQTRLG